MSIAQRIERAIHDLYRVRRERIIYDDNYGIWTEQDQKFGSGGGL